MVSAYCDAAFSLDDETAYDTGPVWSDPERTRPSVLMASCTDLETDPLSGSIVGRDCVNGTLMPRLLLPPDSANYTLIHEVFQSEGWKHSLQVAEGQDMFMPTESEIVIYNRTRVREAFSII